MIVKLTGGLGNQFFQYAFGKSLEKRTGKKVKYDTYFYDYQEKRQLGLDKFCISYAKWNRCLEKLYRLAYSRKLFRLFGIQVEKDIFCYNEPLKGKIYFAGYWQNMNYIKEYKEELREELVYKYPLSKEQQDILNEINGVQSIAVHIRRGDYLGLQNVYHVASISYYHNAVNQIQNSVQGDRVFYIFSDDIAWCKDNLIIEGDKCVFIDRSISDSPYVDFELMRNCKHFIISNSTFSWWAAYLASYRGKSLYAPQIWFVDSDMQKRVDIALLEEYKLVEE